MDYKDYDAGKSDQDFWFRAKNDLIYKLLRKIKNKNLRILNLGVGTGSDLEILNKFGKTYVIDINKKALDLIPKELCHEKKVSDACNLDYPDNFFDLVVSLDVFEHIKEDKLAVKETHRVLKPQGTLLFSVPAFQALYSSHDKALEHQRRYSKKDLKILFTNFKKTNINYWNFSLFPPIALLRIKNKNSPPKVDTPNPSKFLNNLLFNILKTENTLIEKNIKFPFGITLIGLCEK